MCPPKHKVMSYSSRHPPGGKNFKCVSIGSWPWPTKAAKKSPRKLMILEPVWSMFQADQANIKRKRWYFAH